MKGKIQFSPSAIFLCFNSYVLFFFLGVSANQITTGERPNLVDDPTLSLSLSLSLNISDIVLSYYEINKSLVSMN